MAVTIITDILANKITLFIGLSVNQITFVLLCLFSMSNSCSVFSLFISFLPGFCDFFTLYVICAANMNGIHTGLSSRISSNNESHVHACCYAHSLNLVVSAVTSVSVQAVKFFDMLQTASRFFNESYKRMNVWESVLKEKSKPLKVLGTIGSTGWWSKSKALQKIFGSSKSSSDDGVLSEVLVALNLISEDIDQTFTANTQKDANTHIEFLFKV